MLNLVKLIVLGYTNLFMNTFLSLYELLYFADMRIAYLKFQFAIEYTFRPPRWAAKLEGVENQDTCYGETPFITFDTVLQAVGYRPYDLVVDLGCGTGKPVIFTGYIKGGNAIGVDIVETFVSKGNRIAKRLGIDDKVKFYKIDMIEFITQYLAGIARKGGYDRVIIYIPATAFSTETFKRLENALTWLAGELLDRELCVITLTKTLERPIFERVETIKLLFSWGFSDVHLYRVVSSEQS